MDPKSDEWRTSPNCFEQKKDLFLTEQKLVGNKKIKQGVKRLNNPIEVYVFF